MGRRRRNRQQPQPDTLLTPVVAPPPPTSTTLADRAEQRLAVEPDNTKPVLRRVLDIAATETNGTGPAHEVLRTYIFGGVPIIAACKVCGFVDVLTPAQQAASPPLVGLTR